ncbi:hypothetical protein Desaci_4124 [Desulfosporosinus acidiphilus SJ4]|uniref:Uncharacterized protein n=1 Tax=Desulfosporosinus acidiphilus (strain DSM 22704 / JCM 16185 / SJ4) TaxID=646529 RepID=I4DB12_DESAJ|nr:hypothetical protein [Desulfosporosinus acidiphilus]AFM42986.1 hypothetical protein Desaci_4124 [Desulfosporosinus acidiphilus SJ4]
MSKTTKSESTKTTLLAKQIKCVQCQSRGVRKIGTSHYFCAECCTEFTIFGDSVTMYSISTDGGLLKIS